jgi:hypothetical protein
VYYDYDIKNFKVKFVNKLNFTSDLCYMLYILINCMPGTLIFDGFLK